MSLHIRVIQPNVGSSFLMNADRAEVEVQVVRRWLEGAPIVLDGRQFADLSKVQIRILEGPSVDAGGTRSERWQTAVRASTDVTNELIREPAGSANAASPSQRHALGDPRKVMVIHGRDAEAASSMFQFLRALSLEPLEWSSLVAQTQSGTPYVGDVLDAAFGVARAAVVVLTPDEEVRLRTALRGERDAFTVRLQARPNVFYEAGLAFGRFPRNTVVVEVGEMREASDLGGRHAVRITSSGQWRHDLADRLETAGLAVNRSGREWLTVGTFEDALTARPLQVVDGGPSQDLSHERPNPGDQQRLDRLFRVLPRKAMRAIGAYDFGSAWPEDLAYPVNMFLQELEGVENEFGLAAIEEPRLALRKAGSAFALAEGMNGFSAGHGWRNIGWSSGELEVNPEAFAIAEKRRKGIHAAAVTFLDAHDDFVRRVKDHEFDLSALDSPVPEPAWRKNPAGAQRLTEDERAVPWE
jgi:predicted nucleotide-binding protein